MSTQAAKEASDYFNSLPIEQRRKLAPLLEDYRQMGMAEYAREIGSVTQRMNARMLAIGPTIAAIAKAEK